jgi:hypothetical protein
MHIQKTARHHGPANNSSTYIHTHTYTYTYRKQQEIMEQQAAQNISRIVDEMHITQERYVWTYVCMHGLAYVCIGIHMYVWTYICIYGHTYVCMEHIAHGR